MTLIECIQILHAAGRLDGMNNLLVRWDFRRPNHLAIYHYDGTVEAILFDPTGAAGQPIWDPTKEPQVPQAG